MMIVLHWPDVVNAALNASGLRHGCLWCVYNIVLCIYVHDPNRKFNNIILRLGLLIRSIVYTLWTTLLQSCRVTLLWRALLLPNRTAGLDGKRSVRSVKYYNSNS